MAPAVVTLHGMRKVKINQGQTVVLLGCGPIGQIAVQFAKIMGATKVIAVDILGEKLEEVLNFNKIIFFSERQG